ncbi:MAG: Sec-independent protein translocase protein TatB [Ignavibacteriaceae bacterium]|nr:Sec-independent protein translocase protein TatB [Ignavibacteriaceae bacterium]HRI46459.1 Sec-independent protein translocase protein TatB [Ignavibacteriaceae bacterium]
MFSNIGAGELIMIVLVALLLFGPKKLPEIARTFGKGMNQFKRSLNEVENEIKESINLDDEKEKK